MHAALSEFNRKRSFKKDKEHSHTGHASLEQFQKPDWPFFVKHYFKSWKEFYEQAATFGFEKVCVLVYENLLENAVQELKPCVEFLGYHIDAHLAQCISQEQEGSYHRPPMSDQDLEVIFTQPFTEYELNYYNKTQHQVMQNLLANSANHKD